MRRFFTLAVLLLCTIPFGISVTGCHTKVPITYCNGGDSGPLVGQVAFVSLQPALTGISIDEGAISSSPPPSATDCKGNGVGVSNFVYSTSNPSLVDIQPTTGRICAGVWNRNTGPIGDYTYCTPNGNSGLAYIYANLGATSNPLPVFVHPVISNIVLGPPSTNCATDPATNCGAAALLAAYSSATLPTCNLNATTGCCATPVAATAPPYTYTCVSQGNTVQLAARAYAGSSNISCLVGHLSFTPQITNILNVDQNGVATAQQPGSTLMSAGSGQTSSSAGYFSTCPPASITLTAPGTGSADPTNVTIGENTPQPVVPIVTDINGVNLTGLTLTYNTTTPATITVPGGIINATYPGVSDITAVCMPPTCNPAPISELGYNGNGTPLTSNPVTVTTPGTVNTVLYIASTQSQYIVPVDFTVGTIGNPVRLPFVPNSIAADPGKSTLYFGTPTELMIFSVPAAALIREDSSVSGKVISVSPDNTTLVVSDPARQIIYLYATNVGSASGGIVSTYGGVATSAQWTPDSQTVYISTTSNQLLVHSSFSGWTSTTVPVPSPSLALTVPSIGAYLAGPTTTGVSYCPSSTLNTTTTPPTTTSSFYPVADLSAATTDQIVATNDGHHMLGASVTGPSLAPTFVDLSLTLPLPLTLTSTVSNVCPTPPQTVTPGYFKSTFTTQPLTGVTASSITGVATATDSSVAYVTYTGSGGVLPAYVPSASGPGTLTEVPLLTNGVANPALAPVAGVFSTDNATFYAGTSGDNEVHLIINQKDTRAIAPNLPGINGGIAVPNLLVQKPKTVL